MTLPTPRPEQAAAWPVSRVRRASEQATVATASHIEEFGVLDDHHLLLRLGLGDDGIRGLDVCNHDALQGNKGRSVLDRTDVLRLESTR